MYLTGTLMCLLSYSPGCDMLEINYSSASFSLKEGDLLTLNCTVWHQQKQSSDLKVYWCKQVENQNRCARVGKELERLLSTERLNPQARVSFSLLLQIRNVSHSDSGGYQCRASASNQTAMGHYIRVKVTGKHMESLVLWVRLAHSCLEVNVDFVRVGAHRDGAHKVRASTAELLLTELNYFSISHE
uniref:Ig-like domain-containing protein n=1 Tax=Chelydra serpentina TaxID=8475 RepID=A0A8C3XS36_CHESE